jgi:hypothetical protein
MQLDEDKAFKFREKVINSLTSLHLKMDFANGRLQKVEKKVDFHEKVLWMVMGGGMIVGYALSYLLARR